MRYSKLTYIDGQVVKTDVKEIDQLKLTSDCWLIQFNGLQACSECEFRNTKDCGGGKTLKLLKNKSKAKNHESSEGIKNSRNQWKTNGCRKARQSHALCKKNHEKEDR